VKTYKNIVELLGLLKLKGMVKSLDEIVNEAEAQRLSYLSLLHTLLQAEIAYRAERRFQRNLAAAHFPVPKTLDAFEFGRVKGITKADIAQLLDFRWLDNHENLLLFGPPGLGKTHVSIALGMKAIEGGYTVCFEKIVNLIKLLKTQEIQRTAGFRVNRILRSDLLIIDEIGYTPIDRKEANLFFNLISELYEKKSIIITSNKGFETWAEMMGESNKTQCLTARPVNPCHNFRPYTPSLWEDIPDHRRSLPAI
jgi:DNA replication protein DnaC